MNLPVQRLQQVLNLPDGTWLVPDNQFTSWPHNSINLRHYSSKFAPIIKSQNSGVHVVVFHYWSSTWLYQIANEQWKPLMYTSFAAWRKDDQHGGDHKFLGRCWRIHTSHGIFQKDHAHILLEVYLESLYSPHSSPTLFGPLVPLQT